MAGSGSAPQGEKLYAMLLPAAAKRLRGGQRVIVIPDGRLHAFNMETLVDPVSHRLLDRGGNARDGKLHRSAQSSTGGRCAKIDAHRR